MNKSSLSSRLANFLSSAFLVMSLVFAAGLFAHTFVSQDATAAAEAETNSDICQTFNGVDDCVRPATNCLCEIVIRPANKLSEESNS